MLTTTKGLAALMPVSAQMSGATAHFNVFCMPNVSGGDQIVAFVLGRCELDYATLCNYFGLAVPPNHFDVTLAGLSQYLDGTGGAWHSSCDSTDIHSDVKINPSLNAALSAALVVAEEVEVFEAVQAKGWNCGASNGEGLSRVLASELYPGVTDSCGYSSVAVWLDGPRLDFVRNTDPTDRNMESAGCAVLFLNWMHTKLGYGWDKICQAGGNYLADTYATVTGNNDGWQRFIAAMNQAFPPGTPCNLNVDNPFLPKQ